MDTKKSFLLYVDTLAILDKLSNEQKGILFNAIYKYHLGELVELDTLLDIVFLNFKCQFERDVIKYEKAAARSRQNGSLGGRPKSTENQSNVNNPEEPTITQNNPVGFLVTQNNPEEPRKPDSVSVSGSVSVNESESDSVSEKDIIDWDGLLKFINKTFNKNYRVIPDKAKKAYIARLTSGYSKQDLFTAMLNAAKAQNNIDTKFNYCTPEFFSRLDKLEYYLNFDPNVKQLVNGFEIPKKENMRKLLTAEN